MTAMTLYMNQRAFSWGRVLPLTDSSGHTRYTVTGDAYAPGKRLWVLDLAGRTAVSIRQSFPALFPRYELEVYGKPGLSITKDLRFSPPQYTISPQPWTLRGSVSACDYTLIQGDAPFASCHPDPEQPGLLALEFQSQNQTEILSALGVMVAANCVLTFQAPTAR